MCFCSVLWFGHVCFQWDEKEKVTYTFKIDLLFTKLPLWNILTVLYQVI